MKNKAIFIIVLLTAICAYFFKETSYAAEAPDKIVISVIKEKKAEVTLEHKKHIDEYQAKCKDCHHTYRQQTQEESPKRCVECHETTKPQTTQGRKVPLIKTTSMKNIYHDKCIPCHNKLERAGKPFPKKCSVCHPIRVEL